MPAPLQSAGPEKIGLLDGTTEDAVFITSVAQVSDYAHRIRQTARQTL